MTPKSEDVDPRILRLEKWDKSFDKFETELSHDVQLARDILMKNRGHFYRRVYVRAVFTYFEGVNHLLKTGVLKLHDPGDETELLMKNERKVKGRDGKIRIINSFKSFSESLQITFDTFAWTGDANEYKFKKNSKEWNDLIFSIELRNRIVHPKKRTDLNISVDEVKTIEQVYFWYGKQLISLFTKVIKGKIKLRKALERNWKAAQAKCP